MSNSGKVIIMQILMIENELCVWCTYAYYYQQVSYPH